MPEQPEEDLVPPPKIMRKRLNGVYRADSGFHGPTRRYVLIVALLVGLASVPTLAAITAGSSELAGGKTDTMDIPLLPPASPGPIRGASPSATRASSAPPPADARVGSSPSTAPDSSSSGAGAAPPPVAGVAGAAVRAGRLVGRAGERRPRRGSGPSSSTGSVRREQGDAFGYADGRRKPSGASGATGSDKPPAGPDETGGTPDETSGTPDTPSMVAFPALPGMPVVPRLPAVGGRSAHPHSDSNDLSDIDRSPGDPSDGADHDSDAAAPGAGDQAQDLGDRDKAQGSGGRDQAQDSGAGDQAQDSGDRVQVRDSGAGDQVRDSGDGDQVRDSGAGDEAQDSGDRVQVRDPGDGDQPSDEEPSHRHRPDWPGDRRCEKQVIVNRRRSTDRSEHSRRKAVADRPQNIRPASILERSYAPGGQNIRRLIPEARTDDNQIATGSYRGSHRAGSMHHADDTPAQRRSSRVGRHHAEPTEDVSGHW